MPLSQEMTERIRIAVCIPTRKALVGHIEKSKVPLGLHHIANLAPLRLGRVNARGVMCAGVQQEDTVGRRSLDIGNHALEVEADGVLVVIAILLDLQTGVLEDSGMVRPAGGGDVDLFAVRVETFEEGPAYP